MSGALVQFQERHDSLRHALTKMSVAALQLAPEYEVKRVFRVMLEATRRNPILLECEQGSLVECAMAGVELGLEVGGVMGEAWLVPFRDKRRGKIAQFVVGYRGFVHLAKRDGFAGLEARIVHAEDLYEVHYGTAPRIEHRPTWKGPIVSAYAVAFERERSQFEVMTLEQLQRVRDDVLDKIKEDWSKQQSPWTRNLDEMYRKTPIRRLSKTLGLTGKMRRAIELEDAQHIEPARETFNNGRVDDLKGKLKNELEGEVVEAKSDS